MKKVLFLTIIMANNILLWSQEPKLARDAIKNGLYMEAAEKYYSIITEEQQKQDVDGELLAEYAYALSLGHNFEFALLYIDRARALNAKYADFYTNQILKIMGYAELAERFNDQDVPSWLSPLKEQLLSKCSISPDAIQKAERSDLKEAYGSALGKHYIRSLVLLKKLEKSFPDAYIIHIVASGVWENIGDLEQSVICLRQGVKLMDDSDTSSQKVTYSKHLEELELKMNSGKLTNSNQELSRNKSGMLMYMGVSITPNMFSLSSRIGLYTEKHFSISSDLMVSSYNGQLSENLGLSIYMTVWKKTYFGIGYNYQMTLNSEEKSVEDLYNLSFSYGVNIFDCDLTFNCLIPLSMESKPRYYIAYGYTFYF